MNLFSELCGCDTVVIKKKMNARFNNDDDATE